MRMLFLAASLGLVMDMPALAQEDPMEAQRCIWRCLSNSKGASDPAYKQCVAKFCDVGGASDESVVSPPIEAHWNYGRHPTLGLSAHIATKQGALGLACGDENQPVALRIENSLIAGESAVIMFDNAEDAFSFTKQTGEMSEQRDSTCGVALSTFRSDRSVVLIDGNMAGASSEGTGIAAGDRTIVVRTGREALDAMPGKRISLKGSSAAIKQLIASCPVARRDIESNCGI